LQQDANSELKATGKKAKRLYEGIFVVGSRVIIKRTKAYSKKQAKIFMIQQLAKELKVSNAACLMRVFDGHIDNYVIEGIEGMED